MDGMSLLVDVLRGWLALLSVLATLYWVFGQQESEDDDLDAHVRPLRGS